jgi:hypothetical protein
MTDLTINTFYTVERVAPMRFLVANGVTIKKGAYVGLDSTGLAGPLSTATYSVPTGGLADQEVTGDGSTVYVTICASGMILKRVTVAGVDNADDLGDAVYMSDDHTFTLTAGGNVKVGRVNEVVDTDDALADVQLYSWEKLGG